MIVVAVVLPVVGYIASFPISGILPSYPASARAILAILAGTSSAAIVAM